MPNILVSTFGATWAIAAELIAMTDKRIDFLDNNPNVIAFKERLSAIDITIIDEIWLVCTQGSTTNEAIENFKKWKDHLQESTLPQIRYLSLDTIEDLTTESECQQMADFIYRVVLKATEQKDDGKLLLSLTGGRKTMSTDMQRAADIFGCDVLFHIADSFGQGENIKEVDDFKQKFLASKASKLNIIEVNSNKRNSYITDIEFPLLSTDFAIELNRNNSAQLQLYSTISQRLAKSESLQFNAYKIRTGNFNQSIFHGLQQLPPSVLLALESEKPSVEWLKKLPKTDLHCHFGGILDAKGLITTAHACKDEIEKIEIINPEFKKWKKKICDFVERKDEISLRPYVVNKDLLRKELFPELPKPLVVSAFLLCFEDNAAYLDCLIFGEFIDNHKYRNITIKRYEPLGDLQGSALMQSESTISAACELLKDYCVEHNLKYLELRCSPCNYTHGGLTELEVVEIMYKHLANFDSCDIRLIVIGSRHGDMKIFDKHVNLTLNLLQSEKYHDFVVGFDVAGDEGVANPASLRNKLLPLLKECIHLTIHAGENQSVENIWGAVYELNTDRVGHGLTLIDNLELMKKFRDKNIVIELCPSSNFQICDYETKEYPLRKYLTEGLKVTLNTDNPGISRTDITNEYKFMAEYADLTKLEVIQLLRNSFQAVFLPKDIKKKLIVEVEEELYNQIMRE